MNAITAEQTSDYYASHAYEHEEGGTTPNDLHRLLARQGYPQRPPQGEPADAQRARLAAHWTAEATRLGVDWTPTPDLPVEQMAASLHAARLAQHPDLPDYLR